MNTVRCSNCGAENAANLSFCTNCGQSLPPANFGSAPPNAVGSIPVAKSKTGRNAAIIGGVGCVLLVFGAIVLCVIFGYIGRNAGNGNLANNSAENSNETIFSNNNLSLSNRGTVKPSNVNSIVFGNSNSSSSDSDSDSKPVSDEEFRNFLPAQVGDYEREGDAVDGNVVEDFPGADRIMKSDYVKKKRVKVVMAQFASPATAKQSYGYFLDGFKGAKAKILLRRKVNNKVGVETGELAVYTYKGVWETMVYAERFGFRITAPDRATLGEFLKSFGSYMQLVGAD